MNKQKNLSSYLIFFIVLLLLLLPFVGGIISNNVHSDNLFTLYGPDGVGRSTINPSSCGDGTDANDNNDYSCFMDLNYIRSDYCYNGPGWPTGWWKIDFSAGGAVSSRTNVYYIDYQEVSTSGVSQVNSISTSSSTKACCKDPNWCVYGSTCYSSYSAIDVASSGNDKRVLCWSTLWQDCDTSSTSCNSCNYYWLATGAGNIGEYNVQDHGGTSCCGDDSGEYYVSTSIPARGTFNACCSTPSFNTCVDASGTCRSGQLSAETSCSDGIDNDCDNKIDKDTPDPDCCNNIDLDTHQNCCTAKGKIWLEGQCCGDDSGEYYTTTGVGPDKCCSANSCVDSTGTCRSGQTAGESSCGDEIDNDCDGLQDLDDPNCCDLDDNLLIRSARYQNALDVCVPKTNVPQCEYR